MFCVHGGWEIWPAPSTVPSRSPCEEEDRKRRARGSRLCPHRAPRRRTPAGIWSVAGDELRQGRLGPLSDGGAPGRGTGSEDRRGRSVLARRNSRRWRLLTGPSGGGERLRLLMGRGETDFLGPVDTGGVCCGWVETVSLYQRVGEGWG